MAYDNDYAARGNWGFHTNQRARGYDRGYEGARRGRDRGDTEMASSQPGAQDWMDRGRMRTGGTGGRITQQDPRSRNLQRDVGGRIGYDHDFGHARVLGGGRDYGAPGRNSGHGFQGGSSGPGDFHRGGVSGGGMNRGGMSGGGHAGAYGSRGYGRDYMDAGTGGNGYGRGQNRGRGATRGAVGYDRDMSDRSRSHSGTYGIQGYGTGYPDSHYGGDGQGGA